MQKAVLACFRLSLSSWLAQKLAASSEAHTGSRRHPAKGATLRPCHVPCPCRACGALHLASPRYCCSPCMANLLRTVVTQTHSRACLTAMAHLMICWLPTPHAQAPAAYPEERCAPGRLPTTPARCARCAPSAAPEARRASRCSQTPVPPRPSLPGCAAQGPAPCCCCEERLPGQAPVQEH